MVKEWDILCFGLCFEAVEAMWMDFERKVRDGKEKKGTCLFVTRWVGILALDIIFGFCFVLWKRMEKGRESVGFDGYFGCFFCKNK